MPTAPAPGVIVNSGMSLLARLGSDSVSGSKFLYNKAKRQLALIMFLSQVLFRRKSFRVSQSSRKPVHRLPFQALMRLRPAKISPCPITHTSLVLQRSIIEGRLLQLHR